ncbi:hypothetical protein LCGC14_1774120 [marine sediment metagenome]|uniref:LamG-like jellyroll fold domain-containing protein n=1 Tax=marine sediment metagenome TaxID=412755 RepID=A0A0F9JX33_9ZZZZ
MTYQGNSRSKTVRQKPVTLDKLTLPRQYQRWDYQDYAHLWTLLSSTEKESWRSDASRRGITPYNAFMRDRLLNLTNLMARWHLDEAQGSIAFDSSKKGNDGTYFGTSPLKGAIDNGRFLDGNDDYFTVPSHPSLNPTTAIAFDFFLLPYSFAHRQAIYDKRMPLQYWAFIEAGGPWMLFAFRSAGVDKDIYSPALQAGVLYHIAYSFNGLTQIASVFYNGNQVAQQNLGVSTIDTGAGTLLLGNATPVANRWLHGLLDHFSIYDVAIPQSLVQLHAERRYP